MCKHEFQLRLDRITSKTQCLYCVNQKLCSLLSCSYCFWKSFLSYEKCVYWSKKNKVKSRDVFLASGKLFLFDCDICKHTFESRPSNIKKNNWCPYCSHTLLCENESCIFCKNNSFAASDMSIYWSKINEVNPGEVFLTSDKMYSCDCNMCGLVFSKRIAYISNGSRCPYTK